MPNIIKTIYKNGVFKPIRKIDIPENTKVEITTLADYPSKNNSKQILKCLRRAQELFIESGDKILPGLEFQRKIRQESQAKKVKIT